MVKKNGLPIKKLACNQPKATTIYVDASDLGWGMSSGTIQTTGAWTNKESLMSINARELTAIYFALKLHAKDFKDQHIKIFTDNMTALKYSSKSGGTASRTLQDLAVKIQELCSQYNLKVEYEHISGQENIQADWLRRQHHTTTKNLLYEAQLPKRIFRLINQRWGP